MPADLALQPLRRYPPADVQRRRAAGGPSASGLCGSQRAGALLLCRVGGGQVTPEEGGVAFQIYRHEEDWTSTYNVRLRKYDHETGKALENAVFFPV